MCYEVHRVSPNPKCPSVPCQDTSRPTREEAQSIADVLNRETLGLAGHYAVEKRIEASFDTA